ncbi:MAG: hypothetical protein M1834_002467 [Cirrosporium novae-zelandiae]|nr:MAG: hypothetical protein M1834_002467 [Cirrosporium novae-zelandiae]
MGNFDEAFQHKLIAWTWSLYSVGMCLILLRFYARLRKSGFRGLAPDDYLMVAATMWYTLLVISLNVIVAGGGSNLFPPAEYASFTKEEIKDRILGSKIVIVSEQAMLNVIYTLKVCLLIMYSRLTMNTRQRLAVTVMSYYVATGWTATEIAFFTACRPFKGYWAVPPPNSQCTTLEHYAIVQACFNISSDFFIGLIPLPIVVAVKVPLKQKIVLSLVFGMGVFVITAAILTKVFNLANVYDPSYMLWYFREASVAVYVANLPLIWPLLREWVPFFRSVSSKPSKIPSYVRRGTSSNPTGTRRSKYTTGHQLSNINTTVRGGSISGLSPDGKKPGFDLKFNKKRGQSPDSDERALNKKPDWGKGDIRRDITIEVEGESLADSDRERSHERLGFA